MKVYLAGSFFDVEKIREYALQIEPFTTITSRWLQQDSHAKDGPEHQQWAIRDLRDILDCEWFVQISDRPNVRGGAHTELGYALALRKHCLIVGDEHNVFHYLPQVILMKTWQDARNFLRDRTAACDYLPWMGGDSR